MKKKLLINIVLIVLTVLGVVGGFGLYRVILHEKDQDQQIQNLQESLSKLSAELESMKVSEIEWQSEGYNYLAIGNSITVHGETGYWWNEIGMAASDEKHDYFHLVLDYLIENNENVMGIPVNFSLWEIQSHDRDETFEYLDHYLSPELDLVTIQLAENVIDLTTYREDYVSLLEHIKRKAPQARILVVGDFWSEDNRNELKIEAIEETGVEYVALDGITDNQEYFCGLGTVVYDKNGQEHVVEHDGVAKHPGDNGMKAIANRIIEVLVSN